MGGFENPRQVGKTVPHLLGRRHATQTRDTPLALLGSGARPVGAVNQVDQMAGKKEVRQAQYGRIAKVGDEGNQTG